TKSTNLMEKGNLRNYFGMSFKVTEEKNVDFDIPIDPLKVKSDLNLRFFKVILRGIRNFILRGNYLLLGILFIINLLLAVLKFNIFNAGFAFAYFSLITLKILSEIKAPRAWGK